MFAEWQIEAPHFSIEKESVGQEDGMNALEVTRGGDSRIT